MLKGIAPCISPELLRTLAEMGHGDELVLADAHFPGHSVGRRVVRADGIAVTTLLEGIMPLFPLDEYAPPLIMMAAVDGDELDSSVEADYLRIVHLHEVDASAPMRIERFAFYERAAGAYAVVMTGDRRKYGNLILKKGLVLDPESRSR